MIKISCPNCGFSKEVEKSIIPSSILNVTCPICKESFEFSAVSIKTSGFFIRALAITIDVLFLILISLIIDFMLDVIIGTVFEGINLLKSESKVNLTLLIINLILFYSYFYFSTYKFGKTLGKKILGIKVVNLKGLKPTKVESLKREVFGKTVSTVTIIGFLWALFDKNNQTIHDKIADTFVISE